MAEGLSPEQSARADSLYRKNKEWGQAVEHAQDLIAQTEATEAKIAAAGGIDKVDRAEIGRYSAMDGLARQGMLHQAEDSRDMNLWRAHDHYQHNKDAYQGQAVLDAEAAGKPTDFGTHPPQKQ